MSIEGVKETYLDYMHTLFVSPQLVVLLETQEIRSEISSALPRLEPAFVHVFGDVALAEPRLISEPFLLEP